MNSWSRHIGWLLGGMMMLLGLGCGSSDTDELKAAPMLQIHVFTPEHPVVTRGDIGAVNPTDADRAEKTISDLRIWVFETGTGNLVGYLNPTLNSIETSTTYHMAVSDAFAENKPNVDVYVMANVTTGNCNLTSLPDGSATRAELETIMIEHSTDKDPFGLTTLTTAVPSGGLPMSGVIKDQTVGGLSPVLTVGTVQVVRAVSKVRFIFSRTSADSQALKINKITLDGGVIPKSEYLFLNGAYAARSSHVNTDSGYEDNVELITLPGDFKVPESPDPARFAYNGAISGQEYENLINAELSKVETDESKREIVAAPECYYFRESDKLVKGKIYYQTGNTDGQGQIIYGEEKNVEFALKEKGDFTRNHTWIVYGYFAGSNNLRIFTVTFTDWTYQPNGEFTSYNW